MKNLEYEKVLRAWGVDFAGMDDTADIEGSPERTAARVVVRDTNEQSWILEKIAEDNLERKREIAGQLQALRDAGLTQIHPYQVTTENSFFFQNYMLRPFVEGEPLDRESYLNNPWRVEALADFLIRFRSHSADRSASSFSIAAYAEDRMKAWRARYPTLTQKLEPSFGKLQKSFFAVHDQLPTAFCHGDYHPLNIVWGRDSIRSVIDWEFCGTKPELYDVALLLGCFGFENPDNLIQAPAIRLTEKLRTAEFAEAVSWEYLLDLTATIRFGWMSEWIRRGDTEALEMELVYIDILVDQKEYIQQRWS